MRPCEADEVGATGHQDRVDVVGLVDVADRHRRHAGLVADAVGERRLEHAAVDRPGADRGLAGRDVADVDAGLLEHARDLDRVFRLDAVGADPVVRGNAHRNRLAGGPYGAHRGEDLQRIAHAVLQRAAVFVGAPVGERRDEGRQQIAVCAVQLQHVEAGAIGHPGCGHELIAHAVHVVAIHRLRALVARRPRQSSDAASNGQLPCCSGASISSQPSWVEPFGPECPSWQQILASVSACTKSTMRFQAASCSRRIHAGAARRDPSLRADAGHLDADEAGAALGALAVVHEVPVGRAAVDRLVLRHRRDDDAVLERHVAQLERREHRPPHVRAVAAGLALEPGFGALEPCLVAQPQVLVADALRARQQRIVELHRVEVEVALDVLEPLERIAGGRLQPQHLGAARILVFAERRRDARLAVQIAGERDRALHRELGARADREMRRRGGIAHQHDIFVGPCLAQHARKIEPARAAQVARVRHQPMAAEIFLEDALAGRDRFLARHRAEAEPVPGRFRALDDEGRGVGVELIGVRPDPAVLGLLEDEGEGVVEFLAGAEPHELALAQVDVGPEVLRRTRCGPWSSGRPHATTRSWVFAISAAPSISV